MQSAPAATDTNVTTPTRQNGRPRHLYEVDVLRILTFACVIGVHTTSHTTASDNHFYYALLALLHFTRLVFFSLTAFVLVYSYTLRPKPMSQFWPKRFLLVGVPYLAWSLVYVGSAWLLSVTERGDVPLLVTDLAHGIVTGTAMYHLYFLLVTMQVYLLLPAIMWLVRRTRRHHVLLTVVALVVNLVVYGAYKYWPHSFDWMHGYSKQFFFMYVFFIVSGAVAADHAEAFLTWIRVRRRLIGWGVTGVGVLTLAVWAGQVLLGQSLYAAGTPLQPIEVVWSAAIGMGFLALGAAWADRRDPSTLLARVIDYGSDRSFGIFLSHPFVIFLLLYGDSWLERHVAQPWLTPVTYVLVIVLAVAITELFRWTPLSIPLTGRPSLGSRSAREARRRGRERLASAGGTTTTTARAVRDAGRERSSEAVEPDDALVGETDDVGGSHAER
ncbi:acyltransferase [Curtobacterium sp. MCBD17_003]|uniref:acyltransferase n=1 Tax=Curtobacterium sp. MCBD17_003 TaxID=2175667 RepID=UPI000DA9D1A8|nr:acyltransferase [Curtobacterium sp. MCBD17_003]WIE53260.1 acyltransferase [Curtobacterium sp. MCBD17_003]